MSKLERLGSLDMTWLQIERVVPPLMKPISVPFIKAYVAILYRLFTAIMVPTKQLARN